MKTLFIIFGFLTAATVVIISSERIELNYPIGNFRAVGTPVSPQYKWTQVAPPGSGTHQDEWRPGTYPSAIIPAVAFNNDLWMIGQKRSWSSRDGILWQVHNKHDWGEKISMAHIFFKDKFWISGGMAYSTNTFLNDIWSSADGSAWTQTVKKAEWSPRKGHAVVAFNDRLYLFGGAVSVSKDKVANQYINDVWSSADGIRWNKILDDAPWKATEYPKVLVFKGALWFLGGQGHSDIWRSEDGKNWTLVKTDAPWKQRYDHGAVVFDNFLWVYGGSEKDRRNAYSDVWFSQDGSHWHLQTGKAPWTARSGGNSVTFQDKLWLYGGKHTGHADSFSGDIWTMEARHKHSNLVD